MKEGRIDRRGLAGQARSVGLGEARSKGLENEWRRAVYQPWWAGLTPIGNRR